MEQSNKKKIKVQMIIKLLLAAVLLVLSAFLLKGDVWTFWTWWLLAGVLGFAAMPVTGKLFWRFEDKGWIFSKVLAIAATGFITWFLVSIKLLPFNALTCVAVTVICAVICLLLLKKQSKDGIECFPADHISLIYWEEILFFAAFLMWTYLAGFHPAAYGTEKFMDYGFMEAMMRSTTLPARDLWYSEGHINYYYGGQYFAVFLTKLFPGLPDDGRSYERTAKKWENNQTTSLYSWIYSRYSCFNCRKYALCDLCTDHTIDREADWSGSKQLLVSGRDTLHRV